MRIDVFLHDSDVTEKLDRISATLKKIEEALEKLGVGGASAADLEKIGNVAATEATKAQQVADAATKLSETNP